MPMKYDLKITAFPRIHITLIGMNQGSYRINGGIGFSISDPKFYLKFAKAEKFRLEDCRKLPFNNSEIERIRFKIEQIRKEYNFSSTIFCQLSGSSLTHYGFGAGTATYLACIEALFLINGYSYNEDLLKKISSRGGTSGIGINTYFKGGFVFDAGISNNRSEKIAPSSIMTKRKNLPLVLNHITLPDWKLGIVLPEEIQNLTELEEIEFFKNTCPIKKEFVESILYESVYGVLCSLIQEDFNIFCESVRNIQETKWKLEERSLYGEELKVIENEIYNSGAKSVGMSSLGPGLYYFSDKLESVYKTLRSKNIEVLETDFNNSPRIIEYA
jgi:beta-ribofuranosylaminobenzene 5'-phosphate synthase